MRNERTKKFANMRAAKERKRLAAALAEPELPDASHVKLPRRTKAHVEIRVRVGNRWFCTSSHQAPWGDGALNPSRTALTQFVNTTLLLA